MPGMGMGMYQGHFQVQRQVQKQTLEQKLTLKQVLTQKEILILTLDQVPTFKTKGEKDGDHQRKILKKLREDLVDGVYTDWENFHYRCMKRIKKEDRTPEVKELIKS